MKVIITFALILTLQIVLKAQENPNSEANVELGIRNFTGNNLRVKLHPISAIFNGLDIYNLSAKSQLNSGPDRYNYIAGVGYNSFGGVFISRVIPPLITPTASLPGWDYDKFGVSSSFGVVSFGIYKIIIENLGTNRVDSVLVHFDYYINTSETPGDFYVSIYPDNNPSVHGRFIYQFNRNAGIQNDLIEINYSSPRGYTAYAWEPNPGSTINKRPKRFSPPNSEGFEYKIESDPIYNVYSILPLDPRRDCDQPIVSNVNQNHHFPDGTPLEYDERHGFFSLDLIIKKNISTPVARWNQPYNAPPTDVVIMPGVTFTIDKGNPGNNTSYTEYHLKNYSDYTGTNFIVQGPNPEFSGATLKLNHSEVYETNARMRFEEKCKLTLEQGSNTIIQKYGNLIFENGGEMFMHENSNITFYDHGEIIINSGGKVFNCGANITNSSNVCILVNNGGQYHIGSEFCNNNVEHLFDNGSFLVVKNGGELRVADNSNIIFDGPYSFLKVEPGAIVKMGENSRIEFRNGAYLDAEGLTFEGNNGAIWDGLVFHNAGGQTKIENCTLNNAKTPVKIVNTNSSYANLDKKFISNIFNLPSNGSECIYAENVFKLLLQDNTFNISEGNNGVEISNSINSGGLVEELEGGEGSSGGSFGFGTYSLNILENRFNNGKYQLYLNCYASQVTPFWIFQNIFNSSSFTEFGLIGRKISGDLKKNTFANNSQINRNVLLIQSSVNVLDNEKNGLTDNILVGAQSNFKLSPIFQNNQWIWLGGYNKLSSQSNNINIAPSNHYLPQIDKGRNCFSIPTQGSNKYHITGSNVNWSAMLMYYVKENNWSGWMGSNPVINVLNQNQEYINYVYLPTISCPSTALSVFTTEDKGFGIYDTIYYTSGMSGSPDPDPDEELYYQAAYAFLNNDFVTSINSYKSLINGFPESSYTESCLYDFYDSYRSLDTSSDQTYLENLYSDLKNFLSEIIINETHTESFEYVAYEIIQMCESSIGNYNDALTGYEFLSMYHPDPEIRFLASADYAEIMDLIGSGQGNLELSTEAKLSRLELKLSKYIKSDPIARKLSKKFDAKLEEKVMNNSSREYSSREVNTMGKYEKEDIVYNRSQKEIIKKANLLLLNGRSMTKEERRKAVTEGILLMASMTSGDDNSENRLVPSSYSLTQNYPNPFNPVTNISFSIPVEGLVKLKVFDITGREVAVLVNELKTPGSYNVSFNGSTLSSGVYFYRIEAGSFVETKRMLMIK